MSNISHKPNRVILANKPRLLRGLLKRIIQADASLQLVGEVIDLSRLPDLIGETGAQWVILSFSSGGRLPPVAESLLKQSPSTHILALATDGSLVKHKELETQEKDLQDITLAELMGILRQLA